MANIIFIASQRLPTEKAYGIQIAKMCEALASEGAALELLVPIRRNSITQDFFEYYGIKRNFTVTFVPSPDFYWIGIFDRIAFMIKQWISSFRLARVALSRHADAIYSRDEFPIFLASFYSRRPQLVFEAHRFSDSRTRFYKRFKKMGIKIVTISQGIKDRLIEFGYAPEKILVAHDGVSLAEFHNKAGSRESRGELRLPEDKIIVLYAGHLYPWKGASVLAQAARYLNNRYQVVFIGGREQELAEYRKNFPEGNIMFLGWQSHETIPSYLAAADILVLPNSGKEDISRLYTSPLKMFEYMAAGRPIVASNLPSIREVLNDKNATFFKADDPKDLALKVISISEHSEETKQKTQQALNDVIDYSWPKRSSSILKFIS